MAGIKQPILDILNALKEIPALQFIRVWNNQIDYEKSGEQYNFPKPAAFVETLQGLLWDTLALGVSSADLIFRIHIAHEYYDAQDGTFEQDLVVFDIRDAVIEKLQLFKPTGCGPMTKILEEQDYEHDNIYHYTVDFAVNFIDTKGSPLDPDSGKLITKDPPTGLQIQLNVVDNIPGVENNILYPHPGYKPYIPQ
ncbi:hypothetical protein PV783_11570 [Chitinophaga sp. CC14]|uniref:hypothetical protein n=1 Tax=Chitinophaga sp. CC14 TaxID=3029199 RepID=UPI003B808884